MKISDLLSDLTDLHSMRSIVHKQAAIEQSSTPSDSAEQEVMIPPLQQKIELLKKAVNVDSHYDDQDNSDESDSVNDKLNLTINVPKGQSDTKIELTLNSMKKLAGISKPVVTDVADDDDLI